MGDAERGKKIFIQRCAQCHTVGDGAKNKHGPNLFGIVDRGSGQNPTFNYSEAVKSAGITWDDATIEEYLIKPKEFMPGTKSPFPGMRDKADRTNVIEYLKTLK